MSRMYTCVVTKLLTRLDNKRVWVLRYFLICSYEKVKESTAIA